MSPIGDNPHYTSNVPLGGNDPLGFARVDLHYPCMKIEADLRARLAEAEGREQALREATEDALSYLERVREPFGLRYESECDPLIEQLGQALAAARPVTAEPARPDAGGEGQG